jgi:hypothetical protein
MLHRRHTITIATSALIFFCIALHAQSGATSQKSVLYNDAEAYKIYESLLPTDWTVTVAHAKCLLIQAQIGSMNFCPKPDPESTARLHPFHVLEKKDGVWKNLRWKGTSCAWAS